MPYKVKNPVLLRIFRRPEETQQVFSVIKTVKPKKLYIASDGPRSDFPEEKKLVEQCRSIVSDIDWQCEVKTSFKDENHGGPKFGFSSISWFFENEEQGIILEDDNLPHADFFRFCDELLLRYKKEKRIFTITGNNFLGGRKIGNKSYYYSKYNLGWGWASWRRAWKYATLDIPFWPEWKKSSDWFQLYDSVERKYWERIFDKVYSKEKVHWDYAWTASMWHQKGLTVTPNVNLVSNIGFGPGATNTLKSSSPAANVPSKAIGTIEYNDDLKANDMADMFVFNNSFGGKNLRFPLSLIYWPYQWMKLLCKQKISKKTLR